jgi:hypothetical protein
VSHEQFVIKWTARIEAYRSVRAQVDGVLVCEEMLSDFAAAQRHAHDRPLSIPEAVLLTGASRSSFERWIRSGALKNVGRRGSPRFRHGEAVRVAGGIAHRKRQRYSPGADVSSLVDRLTGGNHAP